MAGLSGSGRGFDVNATNEGLTKGLWLYHWLEDFDACALDAEEDATGPGGCSHGGSAADEGIAGGRVATLLLDSEGLGAPGSDLNAYDPKLVALATMLSSAVLFNSMRWALEDHA